MAIINVLLLYSRNIKIQRDYCRSIAKIRRGIVKLFVRVSISTQIVFCFYLCPYACLSVRPSVRSSTSLVSENEDIILHVCLSVRLPVRPPVRLSVSEITNFRYINAHNIKMVNTVICAYYNFLSRQRFFLFLLSGISLADYRAATKGERELHFLCRACCISIPTPESEDDEVNFFPRNLPTP